MTVIERTNARELGPEELPYAPDLITVDVSFISLRQVLPHVKRLLDPPCDVIVIFQKQTAAHRNLLLGFGVHVVRFSEAGTKRSRSQQVVHAVDRILADHVFGIFAGVALLLASIGIYGAVAYTVEQRTGEIGVRMALGAQARDVLALVVGHALKLVGIGTGIGLVLALISTPALSALLYGIGAFDLATFVLVTVVLATIALLASYIPALRASHADPMIAIGHNG